MILFQVDAVPAADVTWWREGEQIENKDEFHIGEDNYHIYDNEDNFVMKMLRMVMTMMKRWGRMMILIIEDNEDDKDDEEAVVFFCKMNIKPPAPLMIS